jgi:hypothetical protein
MDKTRATLRALLRYAISTFNLTDDNYRLELQGQTPLTPLNTAYYEPRRGRADWDLTIKKCLESPIGDL